MEQFFNYAWQRQSWWLWLLLPFSWLYRFITWLNKQAYQIGLKKTYYSPVPVIVIGNISVGGSGKTPLIIALVQYLQAKNIQVGVISRGYGGDTSQMPALVTTQSTPDRVGDEPCLIAQSNAHTGKSVPMAVCPNRGQAIELLLQNFPNTQLILADDGLQHHALDRDQNWIVVDVDRGFGNGQVLPVGFLREPIKRLNQPNTTIIWHKKDWLNTQSSNSQFPQKLPQQNLLMKLEEQPLQPLFVNQLFHQNPTLPPQQVIAMTGIGYPKRFFNSLNNLGFTVIEKPFNDHHNFILADFTNLPQDLSTLPIVVTAKDALKIRLLLQHANSELAQHFMPRIWVLPVLAVLSEEAWRVLDRQVEKLVQK